jgi:hypothetical protein
MLRRGWEYGGLLSLVLGGFFAAKVMPTGCHLVGQGAHGLVNAHQECESAVFGKVIGTNGQWFAWGLAALAFLAGVLIGAAIWSVFKQVARGGTDSNAE